jgi:L-threonylcarbamoyladenylate synthase
METRVLPAADPKALRRAVGLLRGGGIVAFPTDTVYGVGVLAFDAEAIEQLYLAKGRETTKAIAVLVGGMADLDQIAGTMSPLARRLAQAFWPGPLTLVVPIHPDLPENLSPTATVGVRMPDHPAALELLSLAGPLAATSANRSGEPSPSTAQAVLAQLEGRIPLILDGGTTPGGIASTVVNCTESDPVIVREGPISLEQLKMALV